jgi:peptidoglycan/LPS O-acetylase OafA/YrhL
VQAFDVLRGIAVGLVLLRHAFPAEFGGAGVVGVVMFFTLSGYLITGVLVRDVETTGRVRYGRFYRNRAIRLVPSLVAVTAAIVVVALSFDLLNDRSSVVWTVVVSFSYTGDLLSNFGSPAIGHLWTLATEEQFYLVWPLLLVLAINRRRVWTLIVASGVAIYLVCCATVFIGAPHWGFVYSLPTSWSVSMVVGAALFFATRSGGLLSRVLPQMRFALIVLAGLVLAGVSLGPDLKLLPLGYLVGGPVVAFAAATLIDASRPWVTVKSLAMRPLLGLGVVSYSAYLWDYPIRLWLGALIPGAAAGWFSIFGAIALASASWWALERPLQRWKAKLDARARGHASVADPNEPAVTLP